MKPFAIDNTAGVSVEKTGHGDIDTASLVLLFVFAFGFRLIYILQSADNPLFGAALVDAKEYARWAGDDLRFREYQDKYIYGVANHRELLELVGEERIEAIKADPRTGYAVNMSRD